MDHTSLQKNSLLIKKLSQESNDQIFAKNNIMPFDVKKTILSREGKYFKSGHWINKQKVKFCIFMQFFNQIFNERSNRKSLKIYKVMSSFIKTKNPDQCRSFHQKIEAKSSNILFYVNKIKQKIGIQKYKFNYKLYSHQLNSLDLVAQPLTLQQAQFEMNKTIYIQKQNLQAEQYKNTFFGDININLNQLKNQNKYKEKAFETQIKKQEQLKEAPTGTSLVSQKQQNVYQLKIKLKQFENFQNFKQNYNISNQQLSQVTRQCNFYWQKWLKAVLKLQQHKNQLSLNKICMN